MYAPFKFHIQYSKEEKYLQIKLTKTYIIDKIIMLIGGINMILYPQIYVESIKDVSYEFLKQNNINAIILDMDNTIIDFEKNIVERSKTVV